MARYVPHSPEWFKAVASVNPQQAAITRHVIDTAGSPDVCSVCGDAAARDFKIVGAKFGEEVDATVRLCDDCRHIRSAMYGEEFVLLDS